jgi:antitoxin ParD1/3/4
MPARNIVLTKKLKALREAAQIGFAALERGEFKEFDSIADLEGYLDELGEMVISDPTG